MKGSAALNRMGKLLRLARYRQPIFGQLGVGNRFAKDAYISERAHVGNWNYFGSYSMILNAKIGNYCSIAPGVMIGPADHSLDYLTTYNTLSSELVGHEMFGAPAVVGSDVWLASNVVVKQGVVIGNGVVVGANSFVNRDVPDYAIVGGTPARVIRQRFDDKTVSFLEESRWWEADMSGARIKLEEIAKACGMRSSRGSERL